MKETGDLLVGLPCTADNHCAVRSSLAPVPFAVSQDLHSALQGCELQGLGKLDRDFGVWLGIACSACLVRFGVGRSSVAAGKPSED